MEKLAVYPVGVQGAALLILRLSVCVTTAGLVSATPYPLTAALVALALALAIGLFTRSVAFLWVSALAVCAVNHWAGAAVLGAPTLAALALALLGPGAYSIDARLFGRRVIHISDAGGPRRSSRPSPPKG